MAENTYDKVHTAGLNMAGRADKYDGGFAMNSIDFLGLPMITAGINKPEGPEFTVLMEVDRASKCLKKVVLREGRIVGFIALNLVDRIGILTGLMEMEVDVTSLQQLLLKEDFSYVYFSKEYRQGELIKSV